jgi:stage V sporulation protein D (sporulation-specific penicillin-binding protein)
MKQENPNSGFKPNVPRLGVVSLVLVLLLSLVSIKLVKLQIFDAHKFIEERNEKNIASKIRPERGEIFDRNFVPLVKNAYSPFVSCEPRRIANKGGIPDNKGGFVDLSGKPAKDGIANILSATLGTNLKETLKSVVGTDETQYYELVKLQVDPGTAEKLKDFNLDGVNVENGYKRYYPQGNLASNLLGYCEPYNQDGIEGIEAKFNEQLKGKTGFKIYPKDSLSKDNYIIETPAVHGQWLLLTIDSTIQFVAQQRMREAVSHWDADAAVCVIEDPRTGEILAAAQHVKKGLENKYPVNMPMLYQYEPGSVFKGIIAAIGLDCGAINEKMTLSDNGGIKAGDAFFRCDWIANPSRGHGTQNLVQAIRNSCNVVFVQYGQKILEKIGGKKFYEKLLEFGFGAPTGTGLDEHPGGVQKPEVWYASSPWNMFFGRGITVTPIQLINAYSAIANNGYLMKPRIIYEKRDPNTGTSTKENGVTLRKVVSENAARRTMNALTQNVVWNNYDTAYKAGIKGYDIAGKTGTANQINPDGGYYSSRYNCSFMGILPSIDADNKQMLSILVTVVNPKNTNDYSALVGSNVAAPYFRLVAEDVTSLLRIGPKDEIKKPAAKSTTP